MSKVIRTLYGIKKRRYSTGEVISTIAGAVAAIGSTISQGQGIITNVQQFFSNLGIGPSYNPANGGEIARQLAGLDLGNDAFAYSVYMDMVKNCSNKDYWNGKQGVSIWDAPNFVQPSAFLSRFYEYVNMGFPAGSFLMTENGDLILPDGKILPYAIAKEAVKLPQPAPNNYDSGKNKADVVNSQNGGNGATLTGSPQNEFGSGGIILGLILLGFIFRKKIFG